MEEANHSEQHKQPGSSLYRSIVEEQTELICRRTPEGTITFVNDAYCQYYGIPREELVGRRFMPLIPDEDRRKIEQVTALITPENPVVTYVHRTLSTHPEARWLQWTKRGIYDTQGRLVEFQHVGHDITAQKKIEEELRFYTTHDALTGLYNRVFFTTEMERMDPGRMFPISILVCSVAGLAAINDQRGAGAGDQILRQTAQVLRCAFRIEDILARIQEDEFAVLLPHTGEEAARKIFERVRKCVEAERRLEGSEVVRFSLGLATAQEPNTLAHTLSEAQSDLWENNPLENNRDAKRP